MLIAFFLSFFKGPHIRGMRNTALQLSLILLPKSFGRRTNLLQRLHQMEPLNTAENVVTEADSHCRRLGHKLKLLGNKIENTRKVVSHPYVCVCVCRNEK